MSRLSPLYAMAPSHGLVELIHRFVADERTGIALLRRWSALVARAIRRYPPTWLELGQANEEAVESLAHRSLALASRVSVARAPFLGRTPLRTIVEERLDPRAANRLLFFGRGSLLRELLRSDRARNLVDDPAAAWDEALYVAARLHVGHPPGHRTLRRVAQPVLGAAREAVANASRTSGARSTAERVARVARELFPSGSSAHLFAWAPEIEGPMVSATLDTRAALRRLWDELPDAQRELVSRWMLDSPPEAREPRQEVALSRLHRAIALRIAAAMGVPEGTPLGLAPARVVELAAGILREMGVPPAPLEG